MARKAGPGDGAEHSGEAEGEAAPVSDREAGVPEAETASAIEADRLPTTSSVDEPASATDPVFEERLDLEMGRGEAVPLVTPETPPAPGQADVDPLRERPEPAPTVAAPQVAAPLARRRGGFGGLLLGGLIAAALGFGAAWLAQYRFGLLPGRLPAGVEERLAALEARAPGDPEALAGLSARLAEAETRLGALEQAPATAPAPAPDLAPLREELTGGLQALETRTADLESRVAALQAAPVPASDDGAPLGSLAATEAGPAVQPMAAPPAASQEADVPADVTPPLDDLDQAVAGLDARLGTLSGRVDALEPRVQAGEAATADLSQRLGSVEQASASAADEARAAAEALSQAQDRAAAAESQARAGEALAALGHAVDAGTPFADQLAALQASGLAPPETLAALAADGVPTLAALRDSFPEAARAALAAARDEGLLEDGSGLWGFLRGQFGVRSLTPRDGADPDAVLSRAGAQLGEGHLDAALSEIGALPEPVQTAMGDWLAQARTRAEAEAALAALALAPAPTEPPAAD